MSDPVPLILTVRFDPAHQARFDALRDAHFPPERNYLSAHVTLFHALPGAEIPAVSARLAEISSEMSPPKVAVEAPYLLGRGVAFRLVSREVDALRKRLAEHWADWLTPQDRSKNRLHVTVQNKVLPAHARALHAELAAAFTPSRFISPGLDLWRYRGGPWEAAGRFEFGG